MKIPIGEINNTAKLALIAGLVGVVGFVIYKASNLKVSDVIGGITFDPKQSPLYKNSSNHIVDTVKKVFGSSDDGDKAGVQSTQSYIVLRQRDFSSAGVMIESAYTAASKMHASNVNILQRVLTVGRRLQEPYLSAVKSNSEIIVTLDGNIHKF